MKGPNHVPKQLYPKLSDNINIVSCRNCPGIRSKNVIFFHERQGNRRNRITASHDRCICYHRITTTFSKWQSPSTVRRTRSGYHKVGESANVDETLFKSHNYATHSTDHGFKYPWVQSTKEEKKKGPPLLWSPSPVDIHRYEKKSQGIISLRNSSTSQSSKSKHRLTRHTPTFVDESLFGEGLPEPSFESPWAEKVNKGAPIYWAPQESYNRQMTQGSIRDKNKMEPFILDGRPPSRQGPRPGSFRNRPLTVESMTSGKSNSVWKP